MIISPDLSVFRTVWIGQYIIGCYISWPYLPRLTLVAGLEQVCPPRLTHTVLGMIEARFHTSISPLTHPLTLYLPTPFK